MEPLKHAFSSARLPLELRSVPLLQSRDERTSEIVQIDISRESHGRWSAERFRVYRGHDENDLEAVAVDAAQRQVVLFVDEPVRGFEVELPGSSRLPDDAEVVRRTRQTVVIRRYTTGRARHFLCGMDEAHLFIALLPGAAESVPHAQAMLRDPLVDELEEQAPEPTVRQGEWFFVALPASEERTVDHLARRVLPVTRRAGIAETAGIRRIGRPHIADEILVLRGLHAERAGGQRAYVRGGVRHPDHATIVFDRWRRVIPNLEALDAPIEGIDWID